MLAVLGGLADVERDLIRTRTAEGRARQGPRKDHGLPSFPDTGTEERGHQASRAERDAGRTRPQLQCMPSHDFPPHRLTTIGMCQALGPLATITAALAATWITWSIGSRQLQIAKQQADTALGQLRYNLFEKQYAIYNCAMELIKLLENEAYKDEFNPTDVVTYLITLDEARFFFPGDVCNFSRGT
jgi:hypothetical protein